MTNIEEQLTMDLEVDTIEPSTEPSLSEIPPHDFYLLEHYLVPLDKEHIPKDWKEALKDMLVIGDQKAQDAHVLARKVMGKVKTYNTRRSLLGVLESSPGADAAYSHLRECDEQPCKIAMSELLGNISSEVKNILRINNFTKSS